MRIKHLFSFEPSIQETIDGPKITITKRPVGTVVVSSEGEVGMAFPRGGTDPEAFNRKRGVEIATGRAEVGAESDIPNRTVYNSWGLPQSLESLALQTALELQEVR